MKGGSDEAMTYTFIRLDRNLPVPLHFQLAECLRNAIDSGMLEPCEQLPTVGQVVTGQQFPERP